jgi:hypothetical protein
MTKNISEFSAGEIYNWTGSSDQCYSVRRLQIADGPAAGLRMIEVITAGGIRAMLCESRAMDIFELHYKGTNLGFQTKNGLAGASREWLQPGEFVRVWPAGFLATCGLRNTGPGSVEDDGYHMQHGRIGQTPAESVNIAVDEEKMMLTISASIRETALFGHNLVVNRVIEFDLLGSGIRLRDTINNRAAEDEPLFLLYHINFGFPFLSPDLQITYPAGSTVPRNEDAEKGLDRYAEITEPIDGCPENVFFHVPPEVEIDLDKPLSLEKYPAAGTKDDEAEVVLKNEKLGFSTFVSWKWSELPVLTQWKAMKSNDYTMGIEPGNSLIRGRRAELAAGGYPVLAGRSSMSAGFELEFEDLI